MQPLPIRPRCASPRGSNDRTGIVVNIAAAWCISKANRTSLDVEGAYQHVLNDLFAFIGTAVAGLVVLTTGYGRADAIATLLVVVLMLKAGYGLVRESGRVLLEVAPAGVDPHEAPAAGERGERDGAPRAPVPPSAGHAMLRHIPIMTGETRTVTGQH